MLRKLVFKLWLVLVISALGVWFMERWNPNAPRHPLLIDADYSNCTRIAPPLLPKKRITITGRAPVSEVV